MRRKKTVGALDYETYSSERKELYKYQQAAYDSFEKTLLALTSSFLAFSIGLIGYLQSVKPKGTPALVPGTEAFLYASWLAFCLSLLALLFCFFVNARAFTIEMRVLDDALTNAAVLTKRNIWTTVSIALYVFATTAFALGLISLLLFCYRNFLS